MWLSLKPYVSTPSHVLNQMLRPLANICLANIFWPYLFGQRYPFHLCNSGGAVDQIHGDQICDKISIIVVAILAI